MAGSSTARNNSRVIAGDPAATLPEWLVSAFRPAFGDGMADYTEGNSAQESPWLTVKNIEFF
jgi:hypothetical protein